MRQAAITRLTRWSERRHGRDTLPLTVHRRRIYIIPTRFGLALTGMLVAMLLAGLNYNSNLGLAFGFLMMSLALVAMHHCHRNLLGLSVDAKVETDCVAGAPAVFEFRLRNDASVARCEIEIRCAEDPPLVAGGSLVTVPAGGRQSAIVEIPTARRGVRHLPRFEMRTRYPFGWFRAWTYVQIPLTAFVAPRPHGDQALPPATGTAGSAAQSSAPGDDEFSSLRDYQAGMPLKHMAWKVLARGGHPAVRSYTAPAAQPEWLDWCTLEPLGTEDRLSQLCRWVLASESAGRKYGLRLPGLEIAPSRGPTHRTQCLRALALHDHSESS
jgi:uncharacterized protein (DUF58 family)